MQCFYFPSPERGEGRFIKQSGPIGRFAHVVLELATSPASLRGEILWEATEEQIAAEFRPAVTRGLTRVFEAGSKYESHLAAGLIVRVVGGTCHPTDSNETSFEIAAAIAFMNAVGDGPVTPQRTGRAPNS